MPFGRDIDPMGPPLTATEARYRERYEGGHRMDEWMFPLEVEVLRNPYRERLEIRSNIARSFYASSVIDEDQLHRRGSELISLIVREHAHRYAEIIERQMIEQLSRGLGARLSGYGPRVWMEETLSHTRDILRGDTGKDIELTDDPIAALSGVEHRSFENQGWKATLIDTTNAVLKEGVDMSHCMGRAYMSRIYLGNYLAYHITAPEGSQFPKSGFTLGFIKADNTWVYDQLKGKKNSTHYCSDRILLSFVDYITTKINQGQVIREETIEWGKKPKKRKVRT